MDWSDAKGKHIRRAETGSHEHPGVCQALRQPASPLIVNQPAYADSTSNSSYVVDPECWLFRTSRAREAISENTLLRKRPGERIQQQLLLFTVEFSTGSAEEPESWTQRKSNVRTYNVSKRREYEYKKPTITTS